MLRFIRHHALPAYGALAVVGVTGFMNAKGVIDAAKFIGITLPEPLAVAIGWACLGIAIVCTALFAWELAKELLKILKSVRGNKMISVVVGTLCVAGLMWSLINFGLQPTKSVPAANPLDGSIVAECTRAKLPTKVPPEGKLNTLSLWYHPENNLQAIGASPRVGIPGTDWTWDQTNEGESYRCVIKNYSDKTMFNIEIKIQAAYLEFKQKGPNSWGSGDQKYTNDYIVKIPVLKANGDSEYELYVYNQSSYWANFYPKEYATVEKVGDASDQIIKMGISGGMPINFAFGLSPADMSKRMSHHVSR